MAAILSGAGEGQGGFLVLFGLGVAAQALQGLAETAADLGFGALIAVGDDESQRLLEKGDGGRGLIGDELHGTKGSERIGYASTIGHR